MCSLGSCGVTAWRVEGKRSKKRNFSETEINVLVGEVQARKKVLFGRYVH